MSGEDQYIGALNCIVRVPLGFRETPALASLPGTLLPARLVDWRSTFFVEVILNGNAVIRVLEPAPVRKS